MTMTLSTGIEDKDGNVIHQSDLIEGAGSNGPIRFKVVLLEELEDGFNGWYAEEVSSDGIVTRTQRVALKYMTNIKIVARIK